MLSPDLKTISVETIPYFVFNHQENSANVQYELLFYKTDKSSF